jgi:hypothetical protein
MYAAFEILCQGVMLFIAPGTKNALDIQNSSDGLFQVPTQH